MLLQAAHVSVCRVLNGRTVNWTLLTQRYSHSYGFPSTSRQTHTELWLSMSVCVSNKRHNQVIHRLFDFVFLYGYQIVTTFIWFFCMLAQNRFPTSLQMVWLQSVTIKIYLWNNYLIIYFSVEDWLLVAQNHSCVLLWNPTATHTNMCWSVFQSVNILKASHYHTEKILSCTADKGGSSKEGVGLEEESMLA